MITIPTTLLRLTLAATVFFGVTSSMMAGPGAGPMYAMIHGKMMMVTPMTENVTCPNGCKVGMDGMVTMRHGKPFMLKDGEMVTAAGKMMKPAATSAHGG